MKRLNRRCGLRGLSLTVCLIVQECFELFFEGIQRLWNISQVNRKIILNRRRRMTKSATGEASPGNVNIETVRWAISEWLSMQHRIWRKALMRKWTALQALSTWLLKDRISSNVTPRLLTVLETAIKVSPEVTALIPPSFRFLAPVPITMTSDLSGLRARPFSANQLWTERKQSFSLGKVSPSLSSI